MWWGSGVQWSVIRFPRLLHHIYGFIAANCCCLFWHFFSYFLQYMAITHSHSLRSQTWKSLQGKTFSSEGFINSVGRIKPSPRLIHPLFHIKNTKSGEFPTQRNAVRAEVMHGQTLCTAPLSAEQTLPAALRHVPLQNIITKCTYRLLPWAGVPILLFQIMYKYVTQNCTQHFSLLIFLSFSGCIKGCMNQISWL